jgi:RimJ/RimL family protein N-acetyltransferase
VNPVLLDIPMPIETPRLVIREPLHGDGPEVNAAVLESFAELEQWMPWADHKPTVEESEESVRRGYAKWILREDLRLMLFDKQSGIFIGGSGLHRIDWKIPSFEIGYWMRTSFTGRGLIQESTNAITRFAFQQLGAKRVEIRCDSDNGKSISVIKKLGFELEGRLRKNDFGQNGSALLRDTLVYSRLDTEGLPDLDVTW